MLSYDIYYSVYRDKCSWCQIYRGYTDCLPSCKLFLAAALHQPIINLLTRDDWFYDIEQSKVLERFPPMQRMAKFGQPGEISVAKNQYFNVGFSVVSS